MRYTRSNSIRISRRKIKPKTVRKKYTGIGAGGDNDWKPTIISFTVEYKGIQYKLMCEMQEISDVIYFYFRHPDETSYCIGLSYIKNENLFGVNQISMFDAEGRKHKCMLCEAEPCLPEKGSLDIVMMIALGIVEKLSNKDTQVAISDMAFKNNVPLSLLKFLGPKPSTTYSKYGFRLHKSENKQNFNVLLASYRDLYKKQMSKNELTRLGYPNTSKSITYEEYIKEYIDKYYSENGKKSNVTAVNWINFVDFKEVPTIYPGGWYLDWEYYTTIPDRCKVLEINPPISIN